MTLNDSGVQRLTTSISTNAIVILATILRFCCKLSAKNGFHADDWWLLASTISFLCAESATLWGLFAGSEGKEMSTIVEELSSGFTKERLQRLENFLKALHIANSIMYLSFFLVRMSILCLYRRIFATPKFRRLCLFLMAFNLVFFLTAEISYLLLCIPMNRFWKVIDTGGRCLNFNVFSLVVGLIELVFELAILVLPIKAIMSLQMQRKLKALISGVFLVGAFGIIVGILKVYAQYRPNGEYVNFRNAELWAHIHGLTVVLCACFPVYGPLQQMASRMLIKFRDGYTSSLRRVTGGSGRMSRLVDSPMVQPSESPPESLEMKGIYPWSEDPTKESTKNLVVVQALGDPTAERRTR